MSNKIVAICADSPYSATTEDGVVWTQTNAENLRWKLIAGNTSGKYLYSMTDFFNPYVLVDHSTSDSGSVWTTGVLPTPSLPCVVAIAEDGSLSTSFDGLSFITNGLVADLNYNVQYGGNKIFQTCSALSNSTCSIFSAVNAQLFFRTCIAHSVSISSSVTLRVKHVIAFASSFTTSFATTAATFRRTLTTAVSTSIASFVRRFLW